MDCIQPWLMNVLKGSLTRNEGIDESNPLPTEAFRSRKVQFIRFLTRHSWNAKQSMWAEASDREVTILVHIPGDIIHQFELSQRADRRTLNELGYPTFTMGYCKWVWVDPSAEIGGENQRRGLNHQLCLRLDSNPRVHQFRLGSAACWPYPKAQSALSNSGFRHILNINHALARNPQFIQLRRRLISTKPPKLDLEACKMLTKDRIDSEEQVIGQRFFFYKKKKKWWRQWLI
ncbi:hypothetical protein BY996DRAFT_7499293 [Phakopsora pachyrhizi]|nr:hypothetical protein BY996DRAFT_7499293 [Phakopsora pachyrhizi]